MQPWVRAYICVGILRGEILTLLVLVHKFLMNFIVWCLWQLYLRVYQGAIGVSMLKVT